MGSGPPIFGKCPIFISCFYDTFHKYYWEKLSFRPPYIVEEATSMAEKNAIVKMEGLFHIVIPIVLNIVEKMKYVKTLMARKSVFANLEEVLQPSVKIHIAKIQTSVMKSSILQFA